MLNSLDAVAYACPVCDGPAKETEVSIEFWRGGAELFTIWVCEDDACEAHNPMVSHNL